MPRDSSSLERQFLLAWLCSAAVVTFIRRLHATDIGYDTALQIQAGQHLLEGKSLSVYWPTTDDVAKPLTLEVLTVAHSLLGLVGMGAACVHLHEHRHSSGWHLAARGDLGFLMSS